MIWDPETGSVRPAYYWEHGSGSYDDMLLSGEYLAGPPYDETEDYDRETRHGDPT